MLNLRVVAVTGGVSSGKTSVCHIFKQLGATVISADELVHKLLTPQNPVGQQVIALLGQEIVDDGRLDRSKIAKRVFGNPQALAALEKILHPAVRAEIAEEVQKEKSRIENLQKEKNSGETSLIVVEIPLLFEGGFASSYDATIAVIADEKKCQGRFTKATSNTPEDYKKRMARQMDPREKALRADYVIDNNGSMEDLFAATAALYTKLITL